MFENVHLSIIASSAIIYIFIIVAIRFFGKEELSQLSVSDLVFVLLISNSVQNGMVGSDSSVLGGIMAATTLFVLNKIFKYFIYKYKRFNKFMNGEPSILIRHGKINYRQLKRSRISITELEEVARENGNGDLRKIDLAILEVDGKVSILSDENIKKGGKFDIDEKHLQE